VVTATTHAWHLEGATGVRRMQSRPRWTHKDLHGSVDAGQFKVAPALVTQIGDWLSLSRAVLHSLFVAARLRVALWQYFGCRFVPSREHLYRRRDNVADLHVVFWMMTCFVGALSVDAFGSSLGCVLFRRS